MNDLVTDKLDIVDAIANRPTKLYLTVDGYATAVLDLFGKTFTSGNLVIQGCVDPTGGNWTTLKTEDISTAAQLASNQIVAAGLYRVSVAGLKVIRIHSNSFVGVNVWGVMSASMQTAPALGA